MPIRRQWLHSHAVRLALVLAVGVIAVDGLSSQRRAGGNRTVVINGLEAVEGEVLVRYRPDASGVIERQRAEFQTEADEVEAVGRRGARRMRSRRLGTRAMLEALRANPDIEFAEPNYIVTADATPNDPSFGSLWGLFNSGQVLGGSAGLVGADIHAAEAWNVTTGSRSNVVGVIDTGIDYNHPDLAANMWSAPRAFSVTIGGVVITCAAGSHGFNAITNTCNPMDDNSHGTHVAGTIGAVGNNGIGVTGINWIASMMGLKFLSASGSGSTSDAIKAIEFAIQAKAQLGADANVRILSNSWGGGGYSQALKNQIDAANTADMLFVAAAGNAALNNDASPAYPANYTSSNIVSVAAITNRDLRASYSNWGATTVHLGAPGHSILSTVPNNSYAFYNGTSMATPHVAGAAALVLAACHKTTAQLKSALLGMVDPMAALSGLTITGGRLNANAAVRTCTPPSLRVNGQSGALTVAGLSTLTVDVSNGPGFVADWVMMVPAGSPPQTWSTQYKYLSGSRTPPASGLSGASVPFAAPNSTGNYEFRFYLNDGWTLLASSGVVTVNAVPANPVPAVTAVSPTSVVAGSPAVTMTVTGGGFVASSSITVNGLPRTSTYVSPTTMTTVVYADEITTPGTLAIGVRNPAPGGGDSNTPNLTITPPPQALMTANGVSTPVTVAGGSTITVSVSSGPGNRADWVMMVPAGSPPQTWGPYMYLSGSKTAPATGMTSATLRFTAPASGGQFEFRFYMNDGWTLLAKSPVVTVTAGQSSSAPAITVNGSSGAITVLPGATIAVGVSNGPGNISDWVMMVPAGAPPQTWGTYMYLSGSKTRSSSGMTSASLSFTAPSSGSYEFRFYQNDTFTLLATSSIVTVQGAPAAVAVNGSSSPVTVPAGSTITVSVSNGPGNISDWVMMVPAGAPAQTWGTYIYLSGSKTRPATGLRNATVQFSAPAGGGTFEFRFYLNDGWTLLGTSAGVSVTP